MATCKDCREYKGPYKEEGGSMRSPSVRGFSCNLHGLRIMRLNCDRVSDYVSDCDGTVCAQFSQA